MIHPSQSFLIIGHRGAAGEYFENSLQGFRHAVEIGVDAIELDIREHRSGFWVIHDRDLTRLCGVSGNFEDQADISRLRLQNGEPVPSLKQVLDLTWNRVALNIEIKAVQNPAGLLELLDAYPRPSVDGSFPPILISSFNHRALLRLRQLDCRWPLAPINEGVPILTEQHIETLKPWSWHFGNENVDFDLVAQLAAMQVPSFVYTVNDQARARELQEAGVAGIFTDLPTAFVTGRA